jgi:hypothetical protein
LQTFSSSQLPDWLNFERSINAFACTNRRLYLVINYYIYRHNAIEGECSALWWAAKTGQSGSAAKSIAQVVSVNTRWDSYDNRWKLESHTSGGLATWMANGSF